MSPASIVRIRFCGFRLGGSSTAISSSVSSDASGSFWEASSSFFVFVLRLRLGFSSGAASVAAGSVSCPGVPPSSPVSSGSRRTGGSASGSAVIGLSSMASVSLVSRPVSKAVSICSSGCTFFLAIEFSSFKFFILRQD